MKQDVNYVFEVVLGKRDRSPNRRGIGLRTSDFGPIARVLHISRSIRRGTGIKNSKCHSRNRYTRSFRKRVNGLRFRSARLHLCDCRGRPLQQRSVLRVLHPMSPAGFHVFRRFRHWSSFPPDLARHSGDGSWYLRPGWTVEELVGLAK